MIGQHAIAIDRHAGDCCVLPKDCDCSAGDVRLREDRRSPFDADGHAADGPNGGIDLLVEAKAFPLGKLLGIGVVRVPAEAAGDKPPPYTLCLTCILPRL